MQEQASFEPFGKARAFLLAKLSLRIVPTLRSGEAPSAE